MLLFGNARHNLHMHMCVVFVYVWEGARVEFTVTAHPLILIMLVWTFTNRKLNFRGSIQVIDKQKKVYAICSFNHRVVAVNL